MFHQVCGATPFEGFDGFDHFERIPDGATIQTFPLPGRDRELVYAPLGTKEANDYIDDMSLGANFATVNHLLINALVLEAAVRLMAPAREAGTEGITFAEQMKQSAAEIDRAMAHALTAMKAMAGEIGHAARIGPDRKCDLMQERYFSNADLENHIRVAADPG